MKYVIRSAGFVYHPQGEPAPQRTFVVVGSPRGGTSLIAGAMRLAGVDMGSNIDPDNNEDRAFTIHGGDVSLFQDEKRKQNFLADVRENIQNNNKKLEIWGWKDPIVAYYIEEVFPILRSPRFIFILRDAAAVAMRERVELPQQDMKRAGIHLEMNKVGESIDLYQRAFKVLRNAQVPTLVLSYERILRYPQDFAARIADFGGIYHSFHPERRQVVDSIAKFAVADSLTARLPEAGVGKAEKHSSSATLGSFSSFSDAYDKCAKLLNNRQYADAIRVINRLIPLRSSGFLEAPNLVCAPTDALNIEAGLYFMRAVAHANTGEPESSFLSLGNFSAIQQLLSMRDTEGEIVKNLIEPVNRLRASLTAGFS